MTAGLTGILASGATSVTVSLTSNATANLGTPVYSFTNQSIGTATADRLIVVGVAVGNGTNAVSTALINGVSATVSGQVLGNSCRAALLSAMVPNGTTGTISITFAGVNTQVGIATYAAYGAISATPTATNTTSDIDPLTLSLSSVSTGGCVVGVSTNVTAGNNVTWTGLTRDVNGTAGANGWYSAAHAEYTNGTSNISITADQALDTRSALSVASWR